MAVKYNASPPLHFPLPGPKMTQGQRLLVTAPEGIHCIRCRPIGVGFSASSGSLDVLQPAAGTLNLVDYDVIVIHR